MDTEDVTLVVKVKLRNLVSLESGLWQFVVEDKFAINKDREWAANVSRHPDGLDCDRSLSSNDYQYRLLESALIPEKELAKFLVDNIKVEG